MADSTLNIDWRSSVVGQWVNSTPGWMSGNDSYTTAVQTGSATWLNLAVATPAYTTQTWIAKQVYYKMRGMDQITAGVYATWVVTGTPDLTASRYTGGLNLPLRDVHVIDSWTF
jgi:hypothetical protein